MDASLDRLHSTFHKMTAEGWDVAGLLKWGFFFIDPDPDKLRQFFGELEDHGYHIEELHQTDDQDWVLQVSKTEVLAAEKLHRRNLAFNELAAACGVALYDGWDVGQK